MSSQQEVNLVVPARNKLILDSEQQERKQQEERQRLEQIQKRKEEKRKRREEAEKLEMEKIKLQEEKEKKYDQPEMMFEADSDDGVEFRRVVKKIRKAYPEAVNKYEVQQKKRSDFIVPDDADEDGEESESGSYDDQNEEESSETPKKVKKQAKVEKKQKKVEKRPVEKRAVEKKKVQVPVKKQKVKVEHKSDRKQHLVKEVSVRWWYALPEWPPADFDYNGKLIELGYRVLDADKFKLEEDVVNGLTKCVAVDGYKGVYKTKTKLIDVRPKESAPTLNNFRAKSIEELTQILKKALTVQIQQLNQVKHKQRGEDELMADLERQLRKLKME